MLYSLLSLWIFGLASLLSGYGKISGKGIKQNYPGYFPTTPEMVQSNGYPAESHVIETVDGYLITVHRIPYGKTPEAGPRGDKPVVFLQHGFLTSSGDWVIIGPDNALGYLLADQGYDVWMGNSRGNTYSRNHIKLNPDNSSKFWDFSFHEQAIYDLPATFDYILKKTERKKLSFVGYSQGTSMIFAMLSMLPSYNNVINSVHALAPAAFVSHAESPLLPVVINFIEKFGLTNGVRKNFELFPGLPDVKLLLQIFCQDGSLTQNICLRSFFQVVGHDYAQVNTTQIHAILSDVPSGASMKQALHLLQMFKTGYFRQFDYGPAGNLKKYGSITPPNYPLERMTAPISLHYADNDWVIAVEDVEILKAKIPNFIGAFRIPYQKFNHADYILAKDAKTLLYDDLIKLINRFSKN